MAAIPYPEAARERDAWILSQRRRAGGSTREKLDPRRPYAFLTEEELSASGDIVPVATIFLTNRECPWRCLMCDLWKNTLTESLEPGAIPEQIEYALARMEPARHIKLYNNGSFFDHRAIPPEDYGAIAKRLRDFERVIIECHPALVGEDCLRFRDRIGGILEIAMGLETAHPRVLERLNKRMTLDFFSLAAEKLRRHEIALRSFILVKPPYLDEDEALFWAQRSLDFAFDCGTTVAALIPTRLGNGALETLAQRGDFSPPKLETLEAALNYGIGLQRGRVFADLWDLEKFSNCPQCFPIRSARLRQMNLSQEILPKVFCLDCGGSHAS